MQRSSCILCTLNTAETERKRTNPFKEGSALSLSQQRRREGREGSKKIKAAARSVESWRCSSNIQMTEERLEGVLMSPPQCFG